MKPLPGGQGDCRDADPHGDIRDPNWRALDRTFSLPVLTHRELVLGGFWSPMTGLAGWVGRAAAAGPALACVNLHRSMSGGAPEAVIGVTSVGMQAKSEPSPCPLTNGAHDRRFFGCKPDQHRPDRRREIRDSITVSQVQA